MNAFNEINDVTGFANGSEFTSEEQVSVLEGINTSGEMAVPDQDTLDQMAERVIEERWHCNF